jgi:ribonuclease D
MSVADAGRAHRWIDGVQGLESWVQALRENRQVALDLEADSLYRYRERICLVQTSSPSGDAIIDPLALPGLDPLRPLLEDPNVEKVFHGADYDLRLLKGAMAVRPANLFDTMVAAQILGVPRLGLANLLEERFGIRLEKRFQRADWGKRPLPEAMIRYALEDTRHLLRLRDALGKELEAKGRLRWVREEFEALTRLEPVPRTYPDALQVPGAKTLDDRGRAVLQALLEWREEEARRLDLPVFKVMGTATLLELARQRPSAMEEMLGTPGMTRKVLRLRGEGLAEAVARGSAAPPIPWRSTRPHRRTRKNPRADERYAAVKALRDDLAAKLGMDPGILCPNGALKALAGAPSGDLHKRIRECLKAWQQELLAEDFARALD